MPLGISGPIAKTNQPRRVRVDAHPAARGIARRSPHRCAVGMRATIGVVASGCRAHPLGRKPAVSIGDEIAKAAHRSVAADEVRRRGRGTASHVLRQGRRAGRGCRRVGRANGARIRRARDRPVSAPADTGEDEESNRYLVEQGHHDRTQSTCTGGAFAGSAHPGSRCARAICSDTVGAAREPERSVSDHADRPLTDQRRGEGSLDNVADVSSGSHDGDAARAG